MLYQYYNRKNIGKDRRISYGNNTDNLKEKESFEDSWLGFYNQFFILSKVINKNFYEHYCNGCLGIGWGQN